MNKIRNKKIINGILGFILFLSILFVGSWLIINVFSTKVKAEEVRTGSYLGNIKYNGVVGLSDNDYRGILRAPVAFDSNDDRYRDLWNILSSTHQYYYGNRDAFYNFPFNVSLYVSTYDKHLTLDLPAYSLLLVSKDVKVDTMTIWGSTIGFYRDGDLQYSYTKSEIMDYFSTRGYSGFESIYLRFVFDFDFENTPEYQAGYSVGYNGGYDIGYNSGYYNGYGQGFNDLENLTDTEQYELGKRDAQLTALGSFDKWFVPAVIVVIILGGLVTIIQRRKDGDK